MLNPVRDAFFCMAVSRDGKRLAAGTASGQVNLWDVESRRQVAALKVGTTPVTRIAFPDEDTLACVVDGKGLVVLEVPTWEQIEAKEVEAARR